MALTDLDMLLSGRLGTRKVSNSNWSQLRQALAIPIAVCLCSKELHRDQQHCLQLGAEANPHWTADHHQHGVGKTLAAGTGQCEGVKA